MKSALNSVVGEKSKASKTEKHEKVKDRKPVKAEKKVDKKVDGVKKNDVMKKEKKPDSGKAAKKQVESDDDEPLVRFTSTCIKMLIYTFKILSRFCMLQRFS